MAILRDSRFPVVSTAAYLTVRSLIAALSVPRLDISRESVRVFARWYLRQGFSKRSLARAKANLAMAFPDWHEEKVDEVARASHEHLGMLGVEMAYTPRLLTDDGWVNHLDVGPVSQALRTLTSAKPAILITGHTGNWELMGYAMALLGFPIRALFRPLDLPAMDEWVRTVRQRRGLTLVDKFGAVRQLPNLIRSGAPVGFVADQNGGDRGIFTPFFNRLTSTYKSIGLLAMQFNARVVCGMARRQLSGKAPGSLGYVLELVDEFGPEDWNTHPDPLFYLTARYRRSIEMMVMRAPEQYLWMHRIWRSRPKHERVQKPMPASMIEKIRLLPWITDADLERIKDQSARDAQTLAATGQTRLS